jgi:predicted amidohydrolase YtcJ
MWLLNSLALETLLANAAAPPGLEREDGRYTGRLFDADDWLRQALGSQPPDLSAVSRDLAARGLTGLTDMSPRNDPSMAQHFAAQTEAGALVQHVTLAGTLDLAGAEPRGWNLGPAKLHLHENALPEFDHCLGFIRAAHQQGRGVAVHCVTEVELVFTLALFEAAGTVAGDRIEHLSIADPNHIARIAALGLPVCVQPHFITERGAQYLRDVPPADHSHLYRLRSLAEAGMRLLGGSDAPFGSADPWAAMAAAVARQTDGGTIMGADEGLTPERALALYLADPAAPWDERNLTVGDAADLCLLDRPWSDTRCNLASTGVRLTLIGGEVVHDRVDQSPVKRLPGIDPPA